MLKSVFERINSGALTTWKLLIGRSGWSDLKSLNGGCFRFCEVIAGILTWDQVDSNEQSRRSPKHFGILGNLFGFQSRKHRQYLYTNRSAAFLVDDFLQREEAFRSQLVPMHEETYHSTTMMLMTTPMVRVREWVWNFGHGEVSFHDSYSSPSDCCSHQW